MCFVFLCSGKVTVSNDWWSEDGGRTLVVLMLSGADLEKKRDTNILGYSLRWVGWPGEVEFFLIQNKL